MSLLERLEKANKGARRPQVARPRRLRKFAKYRTDEERFIEAVSTLPQWFARVVAGPDDVHRQRIELALSRLMRGSRRGYRDIAVADGEDTESDPRGLIITYRNVSLPVLCVAGNLLVVTVVVEGTWLVGVRPKPDRKPRCQTVMSVPQQF